MSTKRLFLARNIFHICNKSISNYRIFSSAINTQRFIEILDYYNDVSNHKCFSDYINIKGQYESNNVLFQQINSHVKFLAYCIMPDHYHLLVKIIIDKSFPLFIGKVNNSYSRFFNLMHNRKGPLWQSRFRAVLIQSNEQLLHVSRYIHLNPSTAGLVKKPEEWKYSSYNDYINSNTCLDNLKEISIRNPNTYKRFVEDQKDYQRTLKQIKKLTLD